ncbi:VOC family protein [Streptomyces sp. CBMA152]|uniref:VOC family protein n=1 Tax=Streptomyces sp. CBMA152 TaxID=1896312 RepID=UPI001660900E|nr:VOC family protein [Streptomyces sp. CBMA152]MBD0748078.1 glyoxalase [Streptomyces sp. CBMA152]
MLTTLDHVRLTAPAGCEPLLRTFYADLLGMQETSGPPVLAVRGGCWFTGEHGGAQLHLGTQSPYRPGTRTHPGLRVHDLDALADRLRAHRAPVVWDGQLPGHRRFFTLDPVGNRLEFLEPAP